MLVWFLQYRAKNKKIINLYKLTQNLIIMKASKFFYALMAVAMLTLAGCKSSPKDEPTPDPENGTEQGGNEQGGNEQGGSDITCAEAVALAEGTEVSVVGYVTFAYDMGDSKDGQTKEQSVWLADDANASKGVIQAYYLTVTEAAQKGDKVRATGKIKHYQKGDETIIEIVKPGTVTIIEKGQGGGNNENPGTEVTPEGALSCAEAIQQAEGSTVKVVGYVITAFQLNSDGTQSAWLADDPNAQKGLIQAYYCKTSEAVQKGDKVVAEGTFKIFKKEGKEDVPEIDHGSMIIVEKGQGGGNNENPGTEVTPEGALSCAEAIQQAEGSNIKVIGYVITAFKYNSDGTQSAWLADDKDAEKGLIQAYYCKTSKEVKKGDKVVAEGTFKIFKKEGKEDTPEIDHGNMSVVE